MIQNFSCPCVHFCVRDMSGKPESDEGVRTCNVGPTRGFCEGNAQKKIVNSDQYVNPTPTPQPISLS